MFPAVRIHDKCTVFTLNIQIPLLLTIFMEILFSADPVGVGVGRWRSIFLSAQYLVKKLFDSQHIGMDI